MIVEFFGAPGAGKTTLLRRLRERDSTLRTVPLQSRRQVMRGVVRFAARHPLSMVVWSIELILQGKALWRYKATLLAQSMATRAHAERIPSAEICLVDEGFLQRILTLFEHPVSSRHLRFLLAFTPLPHRVVCMSGDTFERFTRGDVPVASPRLLRGKGAFERWAEVVRTNVVLVRKELEGRLQTVVCSRAEANADPDIVLNKLRS